MFIDSHVHFDRFVEDGTLSDILERAREEGVLEMVAVGGSSASNQLSLKLAQDYPGCIFGSAGYDRDEAESDPDMEALRALASDPLIKAIGETGIDYYYSKDTAAQQKKLFEANCAVAAEFSKPVIVHSRDADEDTLGLLGEYVSAWKEERSPGVLHCFTRDIAFARQVLDLGMMISFSGIVTFANADALREVVTYVPDDRLLIETDAPYLAPVPKRGGRNEPAYVVHVAKQLAELKGVSVESMAKTTAENARRLFSL